MPTRMVLMSEPSVLYDTFVTKQHHLPARVGGAHAQGGPTPAPAPRRQRCTPPDALFLTSISFRAMLVPATGYKSRDRRTTNTVCYQKRSGAPGTGDRIWVGHARGPTAPPTTTTPPAQLYSNYYPPTVIATTTTTITIIITIIIQIHPSGPKNYFTLSDDFV